MRDQKTAEESKTLRRHNGNIPLFFLNGLSIKVLYLKGCATAAAFIRVSRDVSVT